MKIFAIFALIIGTLLSGCVVEPQARGDYRGDRDGYRGDRDNVRGERDRDGDGVPNRQDRRPDDPRRY